MSEKEKLSRQQQSERKRKEAGLDTGEGLFGSSDSAITRSTAAVMGGEVKGMNGICHAVWL